MPSESYEACIRTLQAILDSKRIVWFPFIENAATCGLGLVRSLETLSSWQGDPNASPELLEIGNIIGESLTTLLAAAKEYGDNVEQVPEYASTCRDVLSYLQGLLAVLGNLKCRHEDTSCLAFCIQASSIVEELRRHRKQIADTSKILHLARRRFVEDLRRKPLGTGPSIPLPTTPSTLLVDLSGYVDPLGPCSFPVAHGGFADIWLGQWKGRKVAIKVIRLNADDEKGKIKQKRRFNRELQIWQKLRHRHILELYGTTQDFGPPPSLGMVCPWAEQGNLNNYLKHYHDTIKLSERYRILDEVADGLSYLHSASVIHGDLTGSNVLLDESASVRISDFGLSSVIAELQENYSDSCITGAVRWSAPELFTVSPDDGDQLPRPTTFSDVFSFGRVMLQTLSGRIPFDYLRIDGQVFLELYKRLPPRRPFITWITDPQWEFMTRCWAEEPADRPSLREAQDFVQKYQKILVSVPNINER